MLIIVSGGSQSGLLAAPFTWDASGGAPLDDGSGSWNATGGTNWFNGTTYGAWGNTSADTATFGVGNGAAGTITVGSVTTNGITFNAAGSGNYTLSSGTVTLAGTTPTITVNTGGTTSLTSVLAGSAGLTKSGTGTLLLGTANTYTGTTTISQGTLRVTSASNTLGNGTTGAVVLNGGTLDGAWASPVTTTWAITVGANGGVFLGSGSTGQLNLTTNSLYGGGVLTLRSTNGFGRFFNGNQGQANFSGKWVLDGSGGAFWDNFQSVANWGTATGDDVVTLVNNGTVLIRSDLTSSTKGVTIGSGGGVLNGAGGISAVVGVKLSGVGSPTFGPSFDGGILTLTSTLNAYAGDTIIVGKGGGSPWLRLGASEAIPDGAGKGNVVIYNSGARGGFDLNGFSETINGLSSFNGSSFAADSVVDNRAVSTSATLTLGGNNASGTFAGVIQNTGSSATLALTKFGSGTQTLSGANAYTGTTSINAGTLQIGAGSTTGALSGSSVITGSAGATLAFNRSNTVTQGTDFNSVIGGPINVSQLGSGTLVFNNANTYTGTTSINAGTLQIGAGGTTGALSASSVITGSSGATLAFNRSNTITQGSDFNTAIGGAINVTQFGSGTLVFNNTNTFTGTTRINAGTLQIGAGSTTGALSVSSAITGSAGATLAFNRSNTATQGTDFNSTIGGAINVVQIGSGTTVFGTSNTYTGTTTISQGAIQVSGITNTLGNSTNGTVVLNGGSLIAAWTSSLFPTWAIQVGTGGGTIVGSGSGGRWVFSNNLLTGSGTLTLSASNGFNRFDLGSGNTQSNFSGKWVIDGSAAAGFLADNAQGSVWGTGAGSDVVTMRNGGAVLIRTGTVGSSTQGFTIGTGGGVFNGAGGVTATIAAQISGTGSDRVTFRPSQNGVLILSNTANAYSGDTYVLGDSFGTNYVRLGAAGVVPNGAGKGNLVIVNSAGAATGAGIGGFDLNGFSQTINGLSSLAISGTLSTDSVVDNLAANTSATLTLGANNASTTFAGTIQNTGSSATLSLRKIGSGTQTLTGNNTYSGTTTISQGAIQVNGITNTLGNSTNGTVVLDGGAIVAAWTTTQNPGWAIQIGAAGGTIIGSGSGGRWGIASTAFSGSGTLTLQGANNFSRFDTNGNAQAAFSGKWVIDGVGTGIFVDNPQGNVWGTGIGTDVVTMRNGGAILIRGGTVSSSTQGFTIGTGGGVFSGAGGVTATIAAQISGTGSDRVTFRPSQNGVLILSNTANAYSGDTYVLGDSFGTNYVRLGAAGVVPNGAGKGNLVIVNGAGAATGGGAGGFDLNGFSQTINGLSSLAISGTLSTDSVVDNLAANTSATLTLGGNDASATFAGTIQNTGSSATLALRKIGSGIQTLTGSSSYSGATTISAGTLALGANGSFATSPIITVGDAGSSGAVLDLTAKSSGFTFGSSQTVKGIGTIRMTSGRALTINGTLAAGNSPGTITIAGGDLILGGSSITSYEISGTDNTVGSGINDLTTVSGSLALGGTLNVIASPAFDVFGSRTYRVFNYATSGTGSLSGSMAIGTTPDGNYLYSLNTATAGQVNLFVQRRADQATTFSLSTGTVTRALVNTSVTLSGSVSNSSPSGAASLTLGLTGSAGQLSVTGLTAGSVGGGSSLAVGGAIASGSTVGSRTWTVINTDTSTITQSSTASGSLQVVNQRSFAITGGTIALGNFLRTSSPSQSTTVSSSGLNATTASATLDGFTGTNTGGFSLSLTSGTGTNVFDGSLSTQQAVYSLAGSATSAGVITGNFSSNVTAELGSIASLGVALSGTAYDPALPSWTSGTASNAALLLSLGERNQGVGTYSENFSIWNIVQTAGYTADLDLVSITSGSGNFSALSTTLATFTGLSAGTSNQFSTSLSLATPGTFTNTYTLAFTSSKNGTQFNDTPRNLTLTVTGIVVVPEPGALALAGIGTAIAGWECWRRRKATRTQGQSGQV
ncbi:MAG: autotransporter-associated beta strand repeat-containing protein [Planctomycetia bacterium]